MIGVFRPPMGSPGAQLAYAVDYAAVRFDVPVDHIAVDHKHARLLIHDRPHDQDGARVVTVLRASRTGSDVWFEVDEGGTVAAHHPKGDA